MYMSLELHNQVQKERHQEIIRDVEIRRLLRGDKPRQRTWLVRQGCWFLCQLGHWLVRVGRQLQSVGMYQRDMLTSQ